jgi:hypothetical protein
MVSGPHLEPITNFFFCLDNFGFLDVGWVCNLLIQMLLGLARAVTLGSEYRRTHDHILLSQLRLQVPAFISPRNRVAQLHQRALGSLFVASYDSQGYNRAILTRLHTGIAPCSISSSRSCMRALCAAFVTWQTSGQYSSSVEILASVPSSTCCTVQ